MSRCLWLAVSTLLIPRWSVSTPAVRKNKNKTEHLSSQFKTHLVTDSQALTWNELILRVIGTAVKIDQSAQGGNRWLGCLVFIMQSPPTLC